MDNPLLLQRRDTRTAGFYYLLHILLILYGVFFVSIKLGISGTEKMAGNILANEFLFRSGIICRLFCMVPTLFLAFALYRIFAEIKQATGKADDCGFNHVNPFSIYCRSI
jgi:hypothetical protein